MTKRKENRISICRDRNSRTCIKVDEDHGKIKYIPMDIANGFQVEETSIDSFNDRFHELNDYPIERGCQLFLQYCLIVGATPEVLDYLEQIITVTKEEREMSTAKKAVTTTTTEVKKKAPVKTPVSGMTPAKAPVASKAKTPTATKAKTPVKAPVASKAKPPTTAKAKTPAASKTEDGKYTSASQMFQALIMEGKMSDDEIFDKVASEFGLDEKKRSYVKWYRNNLKKKGLNPPEAK